MSARVLVLALDGVPPEILFSEALAPRLPNTRALMRRGAWGPIASTVPPITVPAWASAMTGKDPGELGIYGFRNRADRSYGAMTVATSRSVTARSVWDDVGSSGGRSIVIGLPPGYPPRRIDGEWVGCFLTPSISSAYTWPAALKDEIASVVDGYVFDVEGFRSAARGELLARLHDMTVKRWRVARHLLTTREVDLFILHEIGPDRLHHGFWKDHDAQHRKHDAASPYRSAISDYYALLDGLIGDLVACAPGADVMIVSDHGCKRMDGGIRIDQWLIDHGYLTMRSAAGTPRPFVESEVDWERTRAWAAGGYYGRVWLNVRGREPMGTVAPDQADPLLAEISNGLRSIPDHRGRPLSTRTMRPIEIYREVRGLAPDLMVFFGDLRWRCVATVGGTGWHTLENDTGPDDANHSEEGVIILMGRGGPFDLRTASLIDVAPTLLDLLGLDRPADLAGRSLLHGG